MTFLYQEGVVHFHDCCREGKSWIFQLLISSNYSPNSSWKMLGSAWWHPDRPLGGDTHGRPVSTSPLAPSVRSWGPGRYSHQSWHSEFLLKTKDSWTSTNAEHEGRSTNDSASCEARHSTRPNNMGSEESICESIMKSFADIRIPVALEGQSA